MYMAVSEIGGNLWGPHHKGIPLFGGSFFRGSHIAPAQVPETAEPPAAKPPTAQVRGRTRRGPPSPLFDSVCLIRLLLEGSWYL